MALKDSLSDGLRKLKILSPKETKYLDEYGNPKFVIGTSAFQLQGISKYRRDKKALETYWNWYSGDGAVFAAINTTTWDTVMVGHQINSDNENAQQLIRDFVRKVNLEEVLLDAVTDTLIYGDGFIEIQKDTSGDIAKLRIVDPTTVIINIDDFNRTLSYQQKIGGVIRKTKLMPDEMIHFKFFRNPSSQYGLSIIEPSKEAIDRKVKVDISLFKAIMRHGSPKYVVTVGTPEEIPPKPVFDRIKTDLEDVSSQDEYIIPGVIKMGTIDAQGVAGVERYSDMFLTQVLIGLLAMPEALGLGQGPLHPDTEIFIEDKGFIPITQVKVGDSVATINPESNLIEFQPNKKNWVYPVMEELFNFKGQSLNLKCTKNHRMYYRRQRQNKFEICQAKDLPKNFEFMVGGLGWDGNEQEYFELPPMDYYVGNRWTGGRTKVKTEGMKKIPMDTWLEFMGYFLSEGYTHIVDNESYTIGIRQFSGDSYDEMKRCLEQLPFNIHFDDDRMRICSKQLAIYLQQFGKSYEKHIQKELKNLSVRQLKILYDALMMGDGCENNYFTSSKQLANDVQEILLKMGYGSTIHCRDRIGKDVVINGKRTGKTNYLQYTVTKNEKELTPEVCISESSTHKSTLHKEYYEGNVHCVTVDNGLILTRLDGKCIITGNSTEASARVREILHERMIRSFQHKIENQIRLELFNPNLINNGFKENEVSIKFKSVTSADEEGMAKWLGNLLRGFPEGKKPITINEVRSFFNLENVEGGDELITGSVGGEEINSPVDVTAD